MTLVASVSSPCAGWRISERAGRILRSLGTATFGIFLVHFAVLEVFRAVFPTLVNYDAGAMAATWTVTVLVSTVIALVVSGFLCWSSASDSRNVSATLSTADRRIGGMCLTG